MSDKSNSLLCVGGPENGKWRPDDGQRIFQVSVATPVPVTDDIQDHAKATYTNVVYSQQAISTNNKVFRIFIPHDMNPEDALRMLLEAYPEREPEPEAQPKPED